MRKRFFTITLLSLALIFCTACPKADKSQLINAGFDVFLLSAERQLFKINDGGELDEVVEHFQGYTQQFREFKNQLVQLKSTDYEQLRDAADSMLGLYRNLRCDIGRLGEPLKTRLGKIFDPLDKFVLPLSRFIPEEVDLTGRAVRPANRRNFGLCP